MTIYGSILPGAISIARSAERNGQLTERAKYKLKILDWHHSHGQNISLTSRHLWNALTVQTNKNSIAGETCGTTKEDERGVDRLAEYLEL